MPNNIVRCLGCGLVFAIPEGSVKRVLKEYLSRIEADYLNEERGLREQARLILSKVGDIAGYFVGSAIGKSHPFPKISPGKTTAGCVASLVAGTVAGWIAVATGLLPQASWGVAGALLAGAGVNLAAQAGDLFESWVKRRAGVKDSGTWFGPSGGVLDLIDSLLFSIPAALWLWPRLFDSSPV
jgi:predicted CDP-diglyceride synthetase/phosphatidate cytidylyltransferase